MKDAGKPAGSLAHMPRFGRYLNMIAIRHASSRCGTDLLLRNLKTLNSGASVLQVFDEKFVISRIHLIGAYANAAIAFENRTNKTESVALEMLLFAAMTDQIDEAIHVAGIKKDSEIVIFSNDKRLFRKLHDIVKLGPEFSPSAAETKRRAYAVGMQTKNKKSKDIDAEILQRMALTRLTSS